MKRQFSDDQLKALANVFNIDTGDAFKPLTDKEVADKAREIFPQEQRDKKTRPGRSTTGPTSTNTLKPCRATN